MKRQAPRSAPRVTPSARPGVASKFLQSANTRVGSPTGIQIQPLHAIIGIAVLSLILWMALRQQSGASANSSPAPAPAPVKTT